MHGTMSLKSKDPRTVSFCHPHNDSLTEKIYLVLLQPFTLRKLGITYTK